VTSFAHVDVRVCMTCERCDWSVIHSGPACELYDFLRALAVAHVRAEHPETIPTSDDLDALVLRDLGFY
jgi:hypothetical protein